MAPLPSDRRKIESSVALAQGTYYFVTGVWPFVSMPAFEAVTGKKKEWWLVKTVGALVGVVGGTLLMAGRRGRVTGDLKRVAVGSAVALGGVSAYYAATGRISPVYFLDAVAEAGIIGAWALASASPEAHRQPGDGVDRRGAPRAGSTPELDTGPRSALP